jgi:hypothetical protein
VPVGRVRALDVIIQSMKFGAAEVARAKTLRAVGFPWRPRVGDWYVDHRGYCGLVRTHEESQTIAHSVAVQDSGHSFLPSWDDCREWLSVRGWGRPEIFDEAKGQIRMLVTHEDGRVMRATGDSDLDCLYRLILLLLLNGVSE